MFLRLNINLAKYENDTIFLTCSLSESDPLLLDFVADSSSSSSLVLVYLQFKPNLFPPKFQVSLPLNLRDPTRTGCRSRSLDRKSVV